MIDHPRELLPLVAEGRVPPDDVRAHIATCNSCSNALQALSPLNLDYVWQGIEVELDSSPAPLVERFLSALGMDPSLARFAALAPSLRLPWIVANLGLLGFAVWAVLFDKSTELSPILLVAPVMAAGLVAFAYGPSVDPAYEIVAATPLSPITALLARLTVVLLTNSLFVAAAELVTGSGHGTLAWFLPMTGVALFSLMIGIRTQPMVGAASGIALWSLIVLAAVTLSGTPGRLLWGLTAQAAYASMSLICLGLSLQAIRRGFVTPFRLHR
jgi:hypothetical protein